MNCRKVNHSLSAYIDGELPGVEHLQIHKHLMNCRDCEEEYEALLQMKRLLSGMRIRQPQSDLSNRILVKVHHPDTLTTALPAWLDMAIHWVRTPLPAPYLAAGATLALLSALSLSRAVTTRETFQWKPNLSSAVSQEAVQVESINMHTPDLYSHTLPIIPVGLHCASEPAAPYDSDFIPQRIYPRYSPDIITFPNQSP